VKQASESPVFNRDTRSNTGRFPDRLVAWLLETICEAVGTCLIWGIVFVAGNTDPYLHPHNPFFAVFDFLVLVPVVLLYFGITGYVFTTAFAAVRWRGNGKWFYPIIAALLYILHSQILFLGLNGLHEPLELVLISIFGACITFGCAAAGNRLIVWRAGHL
jgi:hypothetical protein